MKKPDEVENSHSPEIDRNDAGFPLPSPEKLEREPKSKKERECRIEFRADEKFEETSDLVIDSSGPCDLRPGEVHHEDAQ
jgi:hypothetical protein